MVRFSAFFYENEFYGLKYWINLLYFKNRNSGQSKEADTVSIVSIEYRVNDNEPNVAYE